MQLKNINGKTYAACKGGCNECSAALDDSLCPLLCPISTCVNLLQKIKTPFCWRELAVPR